MELVLIYVAAVQLALVEQNDISLTDFIKAPFNFDTAGTSLKIGQHQGGVVVEMGRDRIYWMELYRMMEADTPAELS